MDKYIEATQASGKKFYMEYHDKGKVVMLNLLKFKEIADYTGFDELRPAKEISGEAAYRKYMKHVSPEIKRVGSKVIYYGKANHFIIGPEHEKWDVVLMVEHQSVEKFMSFAQNESYLKFLGHRTAALEDSRLLPSTEF